MENNNPVSFIAFEATCTRLDRIIKRLTIALVVCVLLMFASNAMWLYAWMQYDYTSETTSTETVYTQDGQGTNIIGDSNEVQHVPKQKNEDYHEEADPDEEELEKDQET